jgi:membrane fusion protein (multidrug efflux system)
MKRIAILAIGIMLLIFSACTSNKHEKKEETKFLVTTPINRDTLIYHDYVSQIHSIRRIELRSQERGYLQKISVDEGQIVRKGQLMFEIMPRLYEAEMHKAQAEAKYTAIEYQNTKKLADDKIVSQNELALSKAKLEKANAEVALANAHLGFTRVYAPFDGIVGRLEVRAGSLIEEGELLSTLSDNNKMWVYFNVPEAEYLGYITKLKGNKGTSVKLRMANNELFNQSGIVETIEADFNNETGNIAFRATFPNPNGILRHGETGNILMPVFLKDAIIIPQKATYEILDKKYVFVVDKNNIVRSRLITVGEEVAHLYAVTSGLSATDKILIDGLRKVKNNQKITYDLINAERVLSELNELHAE